MESTTVATAQKLGLTEPEYSSIIGIMGRVPNFTELSIYAVMWSEHCSYKNSIHWLKTLPREGNRLLAGAGEENAGLVDIGDGLACAFKIESHNHPSAIEPFQGAATGVGGIHRDIFTMGARPIACLNSLRFGNPDQPHMRRLIGGVVAGISHYGNCFGVPTVGGEVFFNSCYQQNILVNVMSAGIVAVGKTVSAIASGIGNPVFIVGSATGKDGIHGATFASADLTEDSAADLPAVQVGDPFQEKLLLEATLEAVETGAIVGMQDMGAAGITCSTSEMSAKGGVGMSIDLDLVPTRQRDMKPFEILLSESQERMLIVCHKGMEDKLKAVFDKWDLACAAIGTVTDTGNLVFHQSGNVVAEVNAHSLVLGGGAPVYLRDFSKPEYAERIKKHQTASMPQRKDYAASAKKLLASPNLVSRQWIAEQYDSMVQTATLTTNRPADAAVVWVKGTEKALVLTTDCNPAYVHADPYTGAMMAVAEAARNIVCTGGTPVAITNCLNFGNPHDPGVYWQFVQAIKGMGEACRRLKTPVTGGNVSFYNQTVLADGTEPVFPTPTIGMLGILEDASHHMGLSFQKPGHMLYMLGTPRNDLGSSEYSRTVLEIPLSAAPVFDIDEEIHLQQILSEVIRKRLVESAHDISEGGLFQCLLESALAGNLGFDVETDSNFRKDAYLFGESSSRCVVSVQAHKEDEFVNYLNAHNMPFTRLGEIVSEGITIDGELFGNLETFKTIYEHTLAKKMAGDLNA